MSEPQERHDGTIRISSHSWEEQKTRIRELEAEVARRRGGEMIDDWKVMLEQNENLRQRSREIGAENARLRAALEKIAPHAYGLEQNATDEEQAEYWANVAERARKIARAALAGEEER